MSLEIVSESRSFGGVQAIYKHASAILGCEMRFSVFTPEQARKEPAPVIWWLSGLTCTEENFTVKAGVQAYAAEYGLMVIAPDTSPRGVNIAGEDDAYDFGSGAGFYVDATEAPWTEHYRMYSYINDELPAAVTGRLPLDSSRQSIMGHSMGGHGALTIALKNPDRFMSVSAFAPIVNPCDCPWGLKALTGYLGTDKETWKPYDATELIRAGRKAPGEILIDQGTADGFLDEQLKPWVFEAACRDAGQPCTLRMQAGYDHSYFFIASFIGDHMAHHAAALSG